MKTGVAVAVLAAFAACTTGSSNPTVSPSPAVSKSPTPLAQRLNLPDDVPVIPYHDPADFDQLDAMTWDGQIRGRIGPGFNNGGSPNPQGTLFSTTSDIRDRSGRVVATIDVTASIFWADDGRHYCTLARTGSRDVTSPAELQVVVPGHPPMDVARVGTFSPAGLNAGGPYIVACSPESDRAVVVQSGGQGLGTAEYWVVQLPTGHVLWQRAPGNGVQLAASHDGRLVVENMGAGQSVVYGSDGSVMARLDSWISAFSWDGTLAVTSTTGTGGPVSLTRWRDGTVVWRGSAGTGYGYWGGLTEPGGTRMALGLRDPAFPQTRGFPPVDLYVVSAGGKLTFEQRNIFLFPTL